MKFKISTKIMLNSEQKKEAQKFINKEFVNQESINIIDNNGLIIPDPNIIVTEKHMEAHYNIRQVYEICIEVEIDKYGNFKNMKLV